MNRCQRDRRALLSNGLGAVIGRGYRVITGNDVGYRSAITPLSVCYNCYQKSEVILCKALFFKELRLSGWRQKCYRAFPRKRGVRAATLGPGRPLRWPAEFATMTAGLLPGVPRFSLRNLSPEIEHKSWLLRFLK